MADVRIHDSWKQALAPAFDAPYFAQIKRFILDQRRQGKTIYPPGDLIFHAFDRTPLHRVRVVILGQDPYHGPGQAHGLCFSVPQGVRQPPSLRNILRELHDDLGVEPPTHGDLSHWADQGVLLLNAMLTVNAREAASHRKAGWERFTDDVITTVSQQRDHVVFMLWGGFAKSKARLIDHDRHTVLTAAHPSPLSAHNGFFGCKHFSQANEALRAHGADPVHWSLPED